MKHLLILLCLWVLPSCSNIHRTGFFPYRSYEYYPYGRDGYHYHNNQHHNEDHHHGEGHGGRRHH